jgi:hypothetical protein
MHIFCTADHSHNYREVLDRIEKLERAQNQLELEWASTLDKINRVLGRIAKRAEVAERLEAAQEEQEPPALSVHREPGTTSVGGMLTPQQKSIQQTILRRRAGG